jgi:hypothetical protein
MLADLARPVGLVLALALGTAAALHVYWALGGEWALNESLGVNEAAKRPRYVRALTVPVILALSAALLLTLARIELIGLPVPSWFLRTGSWMLAAVLTAVAVLNAAASTSWERFVIAPIVAMLAALAFVVAAGPDFN